MTPELLIEWLRDESRMGASFCVPGEADPLVLVDQVWLELNMMSSFMEQCDDTGVLERAPEERGVEEQTRQVLEAVVHGYPGQAAEPTGSRRPGRLVKAFPLKFPMGIADPYDEGRPREISMRDYVQHLLRYWTGHFVNGRDGHRVIWALVNSELVREASGKGYVVHSVVMKRLRGRVVGGAVLTKNDLRRVMADEEALRGMVNQLQIMGRDVRSTPMQWAYEKKKFDAAVKCLSWRPVWVRPRAGQEERSFEVGFIDDGYRVEDDLGLGRIPFTWGTLNCRYNFAYDVQRMNVGAEYVRAALVSKMDEQNHVRFAFTRDSPDIVAEMIGLRTELLMEMVMPTIVPHSEEQPF